MKYHFTVSGVGRRKFPVNQRQMGLELKGLFQSVAECKERQPLTMTPSHCFDHWFDNCFQ